MSTKRRTEKTATAGLPWGRIVPLAALVAVAAVLILPRPVVRGAIARVMPASIALARLQLTALATGLLSDAFGRQGQRARAIVRRPQA